MAGELEFSGSALVCKWIYSGGTVTLSGDQRTVTITPSINLINATAGSDADEAYILGTKDATASYSGVAQQGGTATEDALIEGTQGTLEIYPEGNTSGKRKYSMPAISMGPRYNFPYADVVELSVDFQKNGALARTTV